MPIFHRFLRPMLFPARCPICRTVVLPSQALCPKCEKAYPVQEYTRAVPISGAPQRCMGLYDYPSVREAIACFKFRHFPSAARGFALLMAERIRQSGTEADCVIFVPMNRSQQRLRGYNQAELLAKELAKELKLPCLPLLKKVRKTKMQHRLSAEARRSNLRGAYRADASVKGKSVLLCDDIFTTGSTMWACTEALRAAGCVKISEIVIAFAG